MTNKSQLALRFVRSRISHRTGRPLTQAVLTLCLCVFPIFSQEWKTVADGVEHAQVRREFSGKSVDINLLRLDLKKVRLDVHHALDKAIGLETTSSIATRKGAIAAINGGFFRLDKSPLAGEAANTLMIDGELWSDSEIERIGLIFDNASWRTGVQIRPVNSIARILFVSTNTESLHLPLNRESNGHSAIYTHNFGPIVPQSSANWLHAQACTRRIVWSTLCSILEPSTSSDLKQTSLNEFVVSAKPSDGLFYHYLAKHNSRTGKKAIGLSTELFASARSIRFGRATDVIAGLPQLVRNSKIDITWEQEKASKSFVETRHPRTAVAKLKDGKFLMLTVDGRSEASAGLDLYDLAKYMLELGAVDAMNLDGGGSTTMFLDGKVVNKTSDKEGERKIGDAIVVTLRKAVRKKT